MVGTSSHNCAWRLTLLPPLSVPEIDTPSHSDILTRIYPELMTLCNCDGSDCPLNGTFRSMPDPTNPDTWTFLQDVITEVAAMFPDEAFHIGGDEWYVGTLLEGRHGACI